jgi:hydroxymethylglutaryl-CoA lyase/(R)-citramalyl-CoA lyase
LSITLCEVGPRDGLQNEETVLRAPVRAELIARLAAAGLKRIEVGSFVDSRRVPQMAAMEELVAALPRDTEATWAGLVLNERGYDRLAEARLGHVTFAVPVTDAYSERNQGTTTAQSLEVAARIAARARADGRTMTITLAVAFGCPFTGPVEPARVLDAAKRAAQAGADELCLADTIGVAVPAQVGPLVAVVGALDHPVGVHLHNTRNTGYANALAAIEAGATLLDASIGGIGGCPFAPRATGNIATEDLAYLLRGQGVETGLDLDALIDAAAWLGGQLGRELPGELHRAGDFYAGARTRDRSSAVVGTGVSDHS